MMGTWSRVRLVEEALLRVLQRPAQFCDLPPELSGEARQALRPHDQERDDGDQDELRKSDPEHCWVIGDTT